MIPHHKATSGGLIPIMAITSNVLPISDCLRAGIDRDIAMPSELEQLGHDVVPCLPVTNASSAFELRGALAALGGDQAFLNTLASIFLEDAPELIAEIGMAIEQQDGHRLERCAHKLKGSASPFIAPAVSDAAQTLESIGKSGQLAAASEEYFRLEKAIRPLLTALSALVPPPEVMQNSHFNIAVGTEDTTPCTA